MVDPEVRNELERQARLIAALRADVDLLLARLGSAGQPAGSPATLPAAPAQAPAAPVAVPQASEPAPVAAASVPPVAAAASPDEPLLTAMESFHAAVLAGGLAVDPADLAILLKARPALTQAGGERAARLRDLTGFIDRLGLLYAGAAYAPFRDGLVRIRALIPGAEAPPAGLPAPTTAPGRIARALLEELYALLSRGLRKSLRDDLPRLLQEVGALAQADGPATAGPLRSLLNSHARHGERADTPAIRQLLDHGKSAFGWVPVVIPLGERFDPERHDQRRHDRVERPAAGEPGRVIGIRQVGLVDAQGLPIQKCISLVSV